jgi:hypothetical protein
MHVTRFDRRARRAQGLTEHLSPEHTRTADIAAFAAKDVLLDALEIEQVQEIGKDRMHRLNRG